MEIVDEYQKLCQEIWELRNHFYRQYKIKPNNVNVGYEEMTALKNGNIFIMENGFKEKAEEWTVFGMKLKEVNQDNCLSVGFVIE